MPWWSWLLIWTGLVAGLIAMLVYFAISLFRRFTGMYEEFEVLLERADALANASEQQREPASRQPAIFADRAILEYEVERLRRERLFRRQVRRDARIRRAKMLGSSLTD